MQDYIIFDAHYYLVAIQHGGGRHLVFSVQNHIFGIRYIMYRPIRLMMFLP